MEGGEEETRVGFISTRDLLLRVVACGLAGALVFGAAGVWFLWNETERREKRLLDEVRVMITSATDNLVTKEQRYQDREYFKDALGQILEKASRIYREVQR